MSQAPHEDVQDGQTPSGDPDRDTDQDSSQAPGQDTEEHLDADEGDPDLDAYPGETP